MNGEDYKIKYLKYKQKYTNALQNMQGGGDLATALNPQPKAVYVVDKESYKNLKILLGGEKKKITKYDSCVDMLVGVSNPNVIRIKPMKKFKKDITVLKIGKITYGSNSTEFKDGLETINGNAAPSFDPVPFGGRTFGQETGKNLNLNIYSSSQALTDLKNTKQYFIDQCAIKEPHIVVFGADNTLHLCGSLQEPLSAATSVASAELASAASASAASAELASDTLLPK